MSAAKGHMLIPLAQYLDYIAVGFHRRHPLYVEWEKLKDENIEYALTTRELELLQGDYVIYLNVGDEYDGHVCSEDTQAKIDQFRQERDKLPYDFSRGHYKTGVLASFGCQWMMEPIEIDPATIKYPIGFRFNNWGNNELEVIAHEQYINCDYIWYLCRETREYGQPCEYLEEQIEERIR